MTTTTNKENTPLRRRTLRTLTVCTYLDHQTIAWPGSIRGNQETRYVGEPELWDEDATSFQDSL